MLDQMLDSLHFAMEKLGFSKIPLLISKTGWPTAGDLEQPGANVFNAATYNRNLIQRLTAKPPIGTPARPGIAIPTFLFALFDENQKTGPGIERHWGLLRPDGTPIRKEDEESKDPASKMVKKEDEKQSKVTLSGLLNFIDGIWSGCGGERLIVFTTNYIDKLDPALIRRGRMDMHVELSYCCFEAFKVLDPVVLILGYIIDPGVYHRLNNDDPLYIIDIIYIMRILVCCIIFLIMHLYLIV